MAELERSNATPSITSLLVRLWPYVRRDKWMYGIALVAAPVTTARPALPPVPVMLPQPAGPLPPPPVVTASVRQPLVGATYEERRADALLQSDVTATARVRAWSTVLNLSPEQLQALSETAMAELRRETEESLEIDSRSGSMDAQAAAQLKVETLNRQHDTNLRILEKMTPHMSQEQSERMRLMFEAWVQPRLAAARAEQEQAAFPRN